ncbi:uncharacterized protein [Periplaneta americana]
MCENREALLQISQKFTEDTLKCILKRASGSDSIELVDYEVTGSSIRGGDSFLSTLSRIRVEGKINNTPHTLALIVKGLPANIGRRKTFRSTQFFRNEVVFYNKVLRKLMEFQEKKKPKKSFQEIPRCLYALADGENDFVVMEDVSISGYVSGDRKEGQNLDHCVAVLQVLGRFHALSLAMKHQDPQGFSMLSASLEETYFSHELKGWYSGQMKRFCNVAMDAVSKEYPNSIYEEKLKKFADDTLYDRLVEMALPKEPHAVIGHGDTWAPNFMFRYEGDSRSAPVGTYMIDFQLARYASPVLDLAFFLFSCTTQELRTTHYQHLLRTYYQSLAELLQDLGSAPADVFPYDAFQKEIDTYIAFGVGFSLESVPFSVMDEEETPNLDLIEGDKAIPIEQIWHVHPIKSKKGRLRLADNIKFAVDNNYI